MRLFRCCWFHPDARTPDRAGHPLYVYPRQGAGRLDDPEHEYRVLYAATGVAACVAEVFGDFAVWTPELLDPPPHLPGAVRAVVAYDVAATLCDLDDPERLLEFGLRPSGVVSRDRGQTQRWARHIHDTGRFDGVAWWSRRDPRWTCAGLWTYDSATVADVTELETLDDPAVVEAADALVRRVVA